LNKDCDEPIDNTMKTPWRSPIAGAALIVVLTVAAYLPALHGGFLWDDNVFVTDNQALRSLDGLRRIWATQVTAQRYYPLVSTGLWAEYHLWKLQPLGYHLVNILLHAVNAVLVWLILRRLKILGAWLAALVFAIHPVNVASVAWVSEQKNTLSMFFYAVAILLYLRFDEEEGRWWWYGLSLLAFLLALLSKTAVAMLPLVLLGCGWWRHGRVRRKDLLRSVPFFALSLGLGLLTICVENLANGELTVRTVGFLSRLAGAGWTPWFYLYKALLPVNLMVVYPKWSIDASRWVSYVPGIVLIGCLAWFWWKRQTWGRPLLFGLGYFVVTLFPVMGFFDQSFYAYSLVADHWQYCSIIGVIALAVAAGERICRRRDEPRRLLRTMLSAAVLLALGVATWKRGCMYADAEVLWRDNMAKNSKAAVVRNNLGAALVEVGRATEAIAQYEQALQLQPGYSKAHYNLGITLMQVGRVPEAIAQYEQALRIWPDYADAHNNLGIALAQVGRVPEAIAQYEQALRIWPDYADAHNNLGIALARVGRVPEAIAQYEQALRIETDHARAHYNLGIALAQAGRVPEAMDHWKQALRIKPDFAEAHYNLGVTLAQVGRVPEAVAQYEQALQIRPDYVEAHYNLGNVLAGQGRSVEALDHYQKALDSARGQGNTGFVAVVQTRLKLYEPNPSYREQP
jgi:tetratricopeptide (TPR) repeat protein